MRQQAAAAFLSVAITVAIGFYLDRSRTSAPSAPTAPVFFRRIPGALGHDLLALEMEDHYLRIHTMAGSGLILLRLRDAVSELGPQRGRQVHRSWWVAQGAVASVERYNGRHALLLRNGLCVPVSRTFRDDLKKAGWLEG